MALPDRFKSYEFTPSSLSNDISVANYPFAACEAKLLYYPKGTRIPRHRHSTDTLHIVLEGRLDVLVTGADESREIVAGGDYTCGGHEYQGSVQEDTVVLLLQRAGTAFVKSV